MTAIYVHGGVSARIATRRHSLAPAVRDGLHAGSALDAVESSIRTLEDDPELNAGYGSVLNRDGELELDAGIADGATGRSAGVAGVAIRHPISLARRVLQDTPHVLVVGRGAATLAARLGMERLETTTPGQRRRWEQAKDEGALGLERYGEPTRVDTVGAVALDEAGRLCAGSSTGGVFGQMAGRVGDAPVFGAGIYASGAAAAVGTGIGEVFLQNLACLRVGRLIEDGLEPQSACEQTIEFLRERADAEGGVLALDRQGRVGAAFVGASWMVAGPAGSIEPARWELRRD